MPLVDWAGNLCFATTVDKQANVTCHAGWALQYFAAATTSWSRHTSFPGSPPGRSVRATWHGTKRPHTQPFRGQRRVESGRLLAVYTVVKAIAPPTISGHISRCKQCRLRCLPRRFVHGPEEESHRYRQLTVNGCPATIVPRLLLKWGAKRRRGGQHAGTISGTRNYPGRRGPRGRLL
jgi:hypothetical protein